MILVAAGVACLITVPLSGGRLSRLADLDPRRAWLALAALVAQVAIITVAPRGNGALHAAVHVATYVLIVGFLVGNRRLPGMPVVLAGAVANTAAIAANHGVMPAAATAQRLAGLAAGGGFQNSARLAHPHLLWLGDVIPVPGPWPLGNVLSAGDVLIFAGALVLLHRTCRTGRAGAHAHATPRGAV